jgi:hypothetical protein
VTSGSIPLSKKSVELGLNVANVMNHISVNGGVKTPGHTPNTPWGVSVDLTDSLSYVTNSPSPVYFPQPSDYGSPAEFLQAFGIDSWAGEFTDLEL